MSTGNHPVFVCAATVCPSAYWLACYLNAFSFASGFVFVLSVLCKNIHLRTWVGSAIYYALSINFQFSRALTPYDSKYSEFHRTAGRLIDCVTGTTDVVLGRCWPFTADFSRFLWSQERQSLMSIFWFTWIMINILLSEVERMLERPFHCVHPQNKSYLNGNESNLPVADLDQWNCI